MNFVYTVTAADVANGKVQNVATAKWTAGNENRYAPSNICTISTLPSPMSIYKYDAGTSENPAGYQLSETIHYEITVTNNSEEMLNNLQVRDMKKSGDGIVGTIPTLPSGASETVGFDYTVTQADVDEGKVVNVAWIDLNDTTGNSTGYMTIYSNEVYIPTIHAPAEVSVFKSEETSSIDPAGYELHHTAQGLIGFTNHADEPLLNVDIYDLPNGDTAGTYLGTIPQIDPGQQLYLPWGMTVTLEDVERGYMTNAARVEFTDPYTGEPRTEFADEITIKVKPLETVYGGLEVVKSVTNTPANGSYFVEGEEIAFHIDVKNLSGQKVTDLTVYEPLVSGGILKEVGELADGDSVSGIDVSWKAGSEQIFAAVKKYAKERGEDEFSAPMTAHLFLKTNYLSYDYKKHYYTCHSQRIFSEAPHTVFKKCGRLAHYILLLFLFVCRLVKILRVRFAQVDLRAQEGSLF